MYAGMQASPAGLGSAAGELPLLEAIPPRLNRHVDAARSHLSGWVRHHGLVRSGQARERFDQADFAGFAAHTYPEADEAGLCLVADWFAWLFLLDDQFDDGLVGRDLERVKAIVADVRAVLLHDAGAPVEASAILSALADLWRRTVPLSTPRWRDRFVGHIAMCGAAACWEADNRVRGVVPDRVSYVENRRHTGAIYICMDLNEAVEALDIPPEVERDPRYQRALTAAGDVGCWTNDLYSVDKEARLGESHNLVLITEHFGGLSRAQSRAAVARDIEAELRAFLALESQVLAAWPAHEVLLGKVLDGTRACMRGNLDWSRRTPRYHGEPGFADRPEDYLEQVTNAQPRGAK